MIDIIREINEMDRNDSCTKSELEMRLYFEKRAKECREYLKSEKRNDDDGDPKEDAIARHVANIYRNSYMHEHDIIKI